MHVAHLMITRKDPQRPKPWSNIRHTCYRHWYEAKLAFSCVTPMMRTSTQCAPRAHSQGRTHGAQWRRGALVGTTRDANRRHTAHARTAGHPSWSNHYTPNPSTHTNWNSFAPTQAHSIRAQMDQSVELRRRKPPPPGAYASASRTP